MNWFIMGKIIAKFYKFMKTKKNNITNKEESHKLRFFLIIK